jgi:hypothetical protein
VPPSRGTPAAGNKLVQRALRRAGIPRVKSSSQAMWIARSSSSVNGIFGLVWIVASFSGFAGFFSIQPESTQKVTPATRRRAGPR